MCMGGLLRGVPYRLLHRLVYGPSHGLSYMDYPITFRAKNTYMCMLTYLRMRLRFRLGPFVISLAE